MPTLSALDRETFFAAIARHRRASWRVTAACAVAVIVLALVVAILMGPLFYCLVALAADIANFFQPTPDVMGAIGRTLTPVLSGENVPRAAMIQVGLLAAVPGLGLMAVLTWGLRRIWLTSPLFDAGEIPGRPPDRTVLAEERLSNIVEEMSLAAGIAVPRIVIVPGGVNAAACGRDPEHVTLIVGQALPAALDREQLEGLIAHLIASVADGDMTIGLRVTTTLALFGLIARISMSVSDRREFWQTAKLWRVFFAPTADNTVALLGTLADAFHDAPQPAPPARAASGGGLTWREWLSMPLMGPLVLTGFVAGIVTQFLLEPLIALAWRQRKYMADATAVQLTRDPDGIAGALAAIVDSPKGIAPWTAHLAVAADPHGVDGPFGRSIVPIFPSVEKREKALVRMGAHVAPEPRKPMPVWAVVIIGGLLSFAGALMAVAVVMLTMVSAALSGMFTIIPAAILHLILRALAR
jgi:Zn-dependent protease with chaperone function